DTVAQEEVPTDASGVDLTARIGSGLSHRRTHRRASLILRRSPRAMVLTAMPPDARPLVERRRPSTLAELAGNTVAIRSLESWAHAWRDSRGPPSVRAALLEGPPGVGKTSA